MGPKPEAARAIARAAYIFLYPLVANYGAVYETVIDPHSADDFGRWSGWRPVVTVPGRADETVRQSFSTWIDLGSQPSVLEAPPRWWGRHVIQLSDLWGFTPEVTGVGPQRRATGAPYLIGAFRSDATWAGTDAEVRSETRLVNVRCTRERSSRESRCLFADTVEVPSVMSIGAYLGLDPSPPLATNWFRWHEAVLTGRDFWACGAFALSLTRPHPHDLTILDRLSQIGVVAGLDPDPDAFDEEVSCAIDLGMHQAIQDLAGAASGSGNRRTVPTRHQIDRDYFARAVQCSLDPPLGLTQPGLCW